MSVLIRGLVGIGLLSVAGRAHAEPPKPAPSPTPVTVYLRTEQPLVTFSALPANHAAPAATCTAPCDTRLDPGDYQFKLNGISAGNQLKLHDTGTLHGAFESHEAGRQGAWLALNVGGILGGVFITVAALGGPTWAYGAGGGSLAAGGILFLVTYRADRATVSFSPGAPADLPAPSPAHAARALSPAIAEGGGLLARPHTLGVQVAF